MIEMKYRERTLDNSKVWEVYAVSHRITKDMRQFAKELANNEFRHYEWQFVKV